MNLNLTLLGQMLTFALFVWFTMKYVWPPITKALDERQKKIAEGLAAAERGTHELQLAQKKAIELLREARQQAAEVLEQANKRSAQIVDEAKFTARDEGQRLITLARADIAREVEMAKQQLQQQVSAMALQGAEKILTRQIDSAANKDIMKALMTEIQSTT